MSASPSAHFLRPHPEGAVLSLKVQPRASREELGDTLGGELKLKVTAPPVDSAANEAVLRFLAELLDRPKGTIRLIRGATSRHKQVLLVGLDPAEAARRLQPPGGGPGGA